MGRVWQEYGYSMRVPPSYLRDTVFDLIYVNGDNTMPNLRRDEEHWKAAIERAQSGACTDSAEREQARPTAKVVLTEEEFQKRMFEEE